MDFIVREFEEWVRGKGWRQTVTEPGVREQNEYRLSVARQSLPTDELIRFRWSETRADNIWRTELAAHTSKSGDGWFLLQVRNERGWFVDAPRIARELVEGLTIKPSESLQLARTAQQVPYLGVAELVARVQAPERHGLIFVAGTNDQLPFDMFLEKARKWSKELTAQAEFAVLDPVATTEFRSLAGERHAVAPGTIRNFLPGTDFEDPDDALRHRYLATATLTKLHDRALQQLLGRIARRHAATHKLPKDLIADLRTLDRLENKYVLEGGSIATAYDTPAVPALANPVIEPVPPLLPTTPPAPAAAQTTAPVPTAEPATGVDTPTGNDTATTLPKPTTDSVPAAMSAATLSDPELALVREVLGLTAITRDALQAIKIRADADHNAATLLRADRLVEEKQEEINHLEDLLSERNDGIEQLEYQLGLESEDVRDSPTPPTRNSWKSPFCDGNSPRPVPTASSFRHPSEPNTLAPTSNYWTSWSNSRRTASFLRVTRTSVAISTVTTHTARLPTSPGKSS